jgi:regulatory protein
MSTDDERRATIAALRALLDSPQSHPQPVEPSTLAASPQRTVVVSSPEPWDETTEASTSAAGDGRDGAGPGREEPVITDEDAAHDIALRRLSVRARSCAEMRSDLIRRHVSPDVADCVIERLRAVGLLNDREFAVQWVESRRRTKKIATARLRQELKAKGVDDAIIDAQLESMAADEPGLAVEFARKRAATMIGLDQEVVRRRLTAQLHRRGFSWAVITHAVATVMAERDDECR